jgi:hypothetical protein
LVQHCVELCVGVGLCSQIRLCDFAGHEAATPHRGWQSKQGSNVRQITAQHTA